MRFVTGVRRIVLFAAVAASAAVLGARSAPPVVEVTLLATTDFHGALSGGGRERGSGRPWGGAAALAQLVRQERARRPDRTFLLDAGDMMQGTPESNFFWGRSAIAVLNALGTDAGALGNHEFDWGIDTLRARGRDMHYPLLAANVFEKSTGRAPEWLRPYTIVVRDGLRLGIIGFATPETPRVTLPTQVESLRFEAPEPLVADLVRELRRRDADLVVVLAHIGGTQGADGSIAGPIADLARAARRAGADAVIGGHHHTFIAGTVDGIPVVEAGSSGRALGRIVLRWDGERVRGADVDLRRAFGDSLDVPAWDPIAALVDSMRDEVRPIVSRVLGQAARPLGRAALANLVTDAMRTAVHADVAITNPGGLRRNLEAGPITVGDVFELMPFENALVTVRLRGAALVAVVASRPEKVLVSGLRGRWDPERPEAERLVLEHADGGSVRADSTYLVVTNNFLAFGGDGFVGFEDGAEFTVTPMLVRDAIEGAIEAATRAGRPVDPDPEPRFVTRNPERSD